MGRTDSFNLIYNHYSHHKHVYPLPGGEGAAGNAISINTDAADKTHAAGTDQYYWGEPKVIVPVSTITTEWFLAGLYIYGNTISDAIHWHLHKIDPLYSSARNAGNNWDESATILTVADGSLFFAGDLVWVYSTGHTDGEIVEVFSVAGNVITIVRETVQCACPGLRWDHFTDGGGEVMYRCQRDAHEWHCFCGEFSCATAKDFERINFHARLKLTANSGIIIRTINQTDNATSTFEVKVIYEEGLV